MRSEARGLRSKPGTLAMSHELEQCFSPHHPIASNLAPSHARLLSLVDGSRPRQPGTVSIWSEACLCPPLTKKFSDSAEQWLETKDGENHLHPA